MKISKRELNKLRKAGVKVIENNLETTDKDRILADKVKIEELLLEYVSGFAVTTNIERAFYHWIVGILSTVFAKLPKGFFCVDLYAGNDIRKTWTWKDKIRASIFRRL